MGGLYTQPTSPITPRIIITIIILLLPIQWPLSSDTFGEQHRDTTPSQYTQNNNINDNFNPTQYKHTSFSAIPGSTSLLMMGPHSAPEMVAFKIYTGLFSSLGSAATSLSISGNNNTGSSNMASTTTTTTTRSWKPYNTANNVSFSSSLSSSASLPLLILDQDISPLTSPWLGARLTSEIGYSATKGSRSRNGNGGRPLSSTSLQTTGTTTTMMGNKQSASTSNDEDGGSLNPCKKQSPAI